MASGKPEWHEFTSPEALAAALARTVGERLAAAIEARGRALLAVSGGRTPAHFLSLLSRHELDWSRVTVTLADERFVPTSSTRSNARLVAQHLLQNRAAKADFIAHYHETGSAADAARMADTAVTALPLPLDVVVLGMGTDGHVASLFPDAEGIAELLSAEDGPAVVPVAAPSAGEPRLSLSMPALAEARFIALHIEGMDKKESIDKALAAPGPRLPPVRALVERTANPFHVYWAPKQDTKP